MSRLVFLALLSFVVVASATDSTPTCLLSEMELSNGMTLSYPFSQATLNYFCSCLYSTDSTKIKVTPVEGNANLGLTLNDVEVPGLTAGTWSSALHLDVGNNWIDVSVKVGTKCELHYTIQCERQPNTDGQVQGDPMFTGLRGQVYQVHGVAGAIYNLISDEQIQVNSKFVFLTKGKCPVINGKKQKTCFAHPGSYLGEIGIKTVNGDKIKIVSGSAAQGFASVTVNDQVLGLTETLDLSNGATISRNGTHIVTVTASTFSFEFENSDLFINQKVRVNDWDNTIGKAHGLLGQTWSQKTHNGPIKFIEGTVDDYVIQENNVFGDKFQFNKFPVQN